MFIKTVTNDSRKVKRIRNYASKLVLVDVSFTFSLSIRSSGESFQHISSLLHLNSCKTITLAWSTPTQAYLLFAGLVNTQKMISSGFNKNALPQFGGPAINTLQNLSLPFSSKSLIGSANTKGFSLFSWSTCLVNSYHSMSQPSTQLSEWYFPSISILVVFPRSMEAFALLFFQVFWMRSLRDLLDLNKIKAAKSVYASAFLLFASWKSSVSRCFQYLVFLIKTHLLRIESDVSWMLLSASFLWSICSVFLSIQFSSLSVGLGWLFCPGWCNFI